MGSGRFMRVLPLLCLLYASSLAFVLRDWDQEEDNVGRLEDALKVIEKERRRLQEEEEAEAQGYRRRPLPYPWDEDQEESAVTNELLEELLENRASPRVGNSQAADINEIKNILEPSEEEEDQNQAVKESLPIALGGVGEKRVVKKNLPVALGGKGGKREFDPSSQKKKKEEKSHMLSTEDVSKLLSAADDAEEEALENEEAQEKPIIEGEEAPVGPEEVSQEELKEVLEGGEDDKGEEEEEGLSAEEMASLNLPIADGDWSNYPKVPANINKELLLSEYLQNLPPDDFTKKKKRSEKKRSNEMRSEVKQSSVSGNDKVSLAREYIKKFLDLEDDENSNLANALNFATIAQVRRTDSFIPAEVHFLRKAIEDEEILQNLKAEIENSNPEVTEEVIEEEEEERGQPLMRKRTDPRDEDVPILDDEPAMPDNDIVPDDADEVEEEELSPEEEEEFRQFVQKQLQKFLLRSAAHNRYGEDLVWKNEITPGNDEDAIGRWYNGPVNYYQEGIDERDWHLNPFLRDLYEQYQAGNVAKRTFDNDEEESNELFQPEEEDEEEDFSEETEKEIEEALSNYLSQLSGTDASLLERDLCPAMSMLDDCQFAQSMGLRLDAEAMDLCNRHQMCYLCGGAHGITSDECDNGYLEEADQLCDGEDDDCKDDAAGLYLLMLRGHKYIEPEDASHVCRATCATDFIYGLDKKK